MRLTRQTIAQVRVPPGKPYTFVWDEALPGFGVKVNAGGSRQYVVQFRSTGGESKRVTLGRVDALAPDDARRAARETLAKVQLGSDPHAERAEERARAATTLERVVARYLEAVGARLKPRSLDEVTRHLKAHWKPLADLPLHKVKRADVAARLAEISRGHGPIAANRARAALSALYAWAMGQGLVDANVVVGTNRPAEEVARDRVLTNDELAAIWTACREDDHGRIVRLLMLTGQRREEVAGIRWSELDLEDGVWSLPAARTKNKRPHDVPLSSEAVALLRAIPKQRDRDLVFGSGKGGFSGWSKAKKELDTRIAKASDSAEGHPTAEPDPATKAQPWRLHDLRRTAATRMAELGTLPHVVEAVLNHVSGHKSGVAGIYNRATYAPEKKAALELWAVHVSGLLN